MTLIAFTPSSATRAPRMSIRVIPGKQLTGELCARWDEIQRSNPILGSPYFRPEFTQTVAAIRDDVEVAFVEGPQGIEAVLPFQRCGKSAAQPVAGRLSDFHGVIAAPDFHCDPKALLAGCGLSSWRFDHLLTSQQDFQPYMWTTAASPFIDLSTGYQAYLKERKAQTSEIATTERKLRKLEREVGPVRLEWHSTDKTALETLLRWKSEQYLRTGLRDLFTFEWIRSFLDRLLQQDSPGLKGLFSCLYAGDRLVAAHVGMTAHHVMHWWFPSYDRELSKYSPGLGMNLLLTQAAAERGITRLDFGKGDEDYKFKFASGIDHVAEGSVDLHLSSRLFRRTWQATRDWVRTSPLRGPTQAPLRWIRKFRAWLRFQ